MNTVNIQLLPETAGKATLIQDKLNQNEYILNYGNQKKNFDSNITLKVKSEEPLKRFQATPSCGGCTKVFVRVLDNNTREVDVYYNSALLGRINRSVTITVNSENYKIKLIGIISNN